MRYSQVDSQGVPCLVQGVQVYTDMDFVRMVTYRLCSGMYMSIPYAGLQPVIEATDAEIHQHLWAYGERYAADNWVRLHNAST